MRGTEEHVGVIRDKAGIHAGLKQSQATGQQLAVCYRSGGKLLVKICHVRRLSGAHRGVKVSLVTPGNRLDELRLTLADIESIYPIRDYRQ